MNKPQNLFPFLTAAQSVSVRKAIAEYRGPGAALSDAVGSLFIGQIYGWRAVMMMHAKPRIRRFEQILGLSFREVMPERTELTSRVLGVRVADQVGRFWAVVKGEEPVAGGKAYVDDKGQEDLFLSRSVSVTNGSR